MAPIWIGQRRPRWPGKRTGAGSPEADIEAYRQAQLRKLEEFKAPPPSPAASLGEATNKLIVEARLKDIRDYAARAVSVPPPEPGARLSSYLGRLLPVHSCSVQTLGSILQDGGLRARASQARRVRTVFEHLRSESEAKAGPLEPILAKTICGPGSGDLNDELQRGLEDGSAYPAGRRCCQYCINCILNYAELEVNALEFGASRSMLVRRDYLREHLSRHSNLEESDFEAIERISKGMRSLFGAGRFAGVGWQGDAFLGTDSCNFAILGPNADYGRVSLVLDASALALPGTSVTVNAAASFLSGSAYDLRPWALSDELLNPLWGLPDTREEKWVGGGVAQSYYVPHTLYNMVFECKPLSLKNRLGDSLDRQLVWQEDLLLKRDVANRHRVLPDTGSLRYLAAEVAAQARLAFEADPDKWGPAAFAALLEERHDRGETWDMRWWDKPATRPATRGGIPPVGKIAAGARAWSRRNNGGPGVPFTDEHAIDWYESVDPHGRVEVLLPSFVPLSHVVRVILPHDAPTDLVEQLRARNIPVMAVRDEEESLRTQQAYFRGAGGAWEDARSAANRLALQELSLKYSLMVLKGAAGVIRFIFEDSLNVLVQCAFLIKFYHELSTGAIIFTEASMIAGVACSLYGPLKDMYGLWRLREEARNKRCYADLSLHTQSVARGSPEAEPLLAAEELPQGSREDEEAGAPPPSGVEVEHPQGGEDAGAASSSGPDPTRQPRPSGRRHPHPRRQARKPPRTPGVTEETRPGRRTRIEVADLPIVEYLSSPTARHARVAHRVLLAAGFGFWLGMALIPVLFGGEIGDKMVPTSAVFYFAVITLLSLLTEVWIVSHLYSGYMLFRDCGEHLLAVREGETSKALGILAVFFSVLGKYDTFCDVVFAVILWKEAPITWISIHGYVINFHIPLHQVAIFAVVVGVFLCQALPGMLLLARKQFLAASFKLNEFNLLLAMIEIEAAGGA